jgi:hypothetical protein
MISITIGSTSPRKEHPLDARQLQEQLRATLGWRIGDHTARYLLSKMTSGKAKAIPIQVADARTGIPRLLKFQPAQIAEPAQPTLF